MNNRIIQKEKDTNVPIYLSLKIWDLLREDRYVAKKKFLNFIQNLLQQFLLTTI